MSSKAQHRRGRAFRRAAAQKREQGAERNWRKTLERQARGQKVVYGPRYRAIAEQLEDELS